MDKFFKAGDGEPGGALRARVLGVFGCFHEECHPSECPGLTSELASQQPGGASFISGGDMVERSLPDSGPVSPRWRESKIFVQSIKQSLLADGVHLSILLFSQ